MNLVVLAGTHMVADALSCVLRRAGHAVTATIGPRDLARGLVDRTGAEVCVVEIDGASESARRVLESLRRHAPDLRIVVVVERFGPELTAWAAAHHLDELLLRSAGRDDLLAAVDPHSARRGGTRAARANRTSVLSPTEERVLSGLCSGADTHTIATVLGVSDSTVRSHIRSICDKLDVRSRVAAVVVAASLGLGLGGPFELASIEHGAHTPEPTEADAGVGDKPSRSRRS